MSSSVVLKALGLNISPNQLELPNGSLSQATNVIIRRGDILEPRRGFKLYGSLFGTSTDRVSQLFTYKTRILRQYNSTMQYDSDGLGAFNSFSGTFNQAQPGLRTKSIESNGNFYFTSAAGIQLISAATALDFTTNTGFIINAGVPKAIDFTAVPIPPPPGAIGFLPQDSTVAYKTTWATNDANGNLKIGSPSQAVAVYSPILSLLIPNLLSTLEALNNVGLNPTASFFASAFDFVNAFKVPANASSVQVGVSLISLAIQIDNSIIYANDTGAGGVPLTIVSATSPATGILRITFGADPSPYFSATQNTKNIFLAGFIDSTTPATTPLINGAHVIAAVDTVANSIDINVPSVVAADTITIAGTSIVSNIYRSITLPLTQSSPPTADELASLQTFLANIIAGLQAESNSVISSGNHTSFINPLTISGSSNVQLTIQIPQDVTANDFLQIYRSVTVTAIGVDVLNDLVANGEETQLVYEAYPTAAELAAGQMIVNDITPDIFKGANLYTNASTGEGILQANDIPPFALDINRFKNVIFYANTRTRHRITPFSLIGVSNMIVDATNGIIPTITIANALGVSNTYKFILGVAQKSTIIARADVAGDLAGTYFLISSANNTINYYVWFKVSGVGTDPAIAGRTGILVNILTGDTASTVANAVSNAIATVVGDFNTSISTATVTIINTAVGFTTAITAGTSGFTSPTVVISGAGESAASKEVLLSTDISPAIAVDQTARSLVRVINANSNEVIYAYYTSTLGQVPGKMVLEARTLTTTPFYIVANDTNTGSSFVPNLSPDQTNSGAGIISAANPTVITSATSLASEGLVNNSQIIITGSNSTPSVNGVHTITVTGANTFTIPVHVTVAGTKIAYSNITSATVSQNEVKPNRIYYSKLQQPESVPIVNFLEVGAADKAIVRIFPLRDSLFVLKEDGLFRISGEIIPFYLSLFDSSCICIAADSVAVANNLIYAYTEQGISTISEAGVSSPPASRPIDTEILKISSASFTNFKTSTWGVGYESDNSYIVFTVQKTTDTHASVGYRYSNLTNTWTTIDKDGVCGVVNSFDDKLYLGAGDTDFIEQERKNFDRTDYADREITSSIAINSYIGNNIFIRLATVSQFAVGDVVLQDQLLTIYKYNNLLKKLDIDPTLAAVNITAITGSAVLLTITAANHNLVNGNYVTILNNTSVPNINGTYIVSGVSGATFQVTIATPLTNIIIDGQARLSYFGSLQILAGADLRTALTALTTKLDTDPGAALTNYSALITNLTGSITNIAVGTPPIITSAAHGLLTGRYISIASSNSIPVIDGNWAVTVLTANTFTIPTMVNTAGTTGTFTTEINSFQDLQGSYNIIIGNLNIDTGLTFHNYLPILEDTIMETNITSVNSSTKTITIDAPLDFVVGPITIYKAISSTVVYSPNTIGDPLGLKHMQEATIMFSNKAFTSATLSFASDLLPAFLDVPFLGAGNGIFGSGAFGSGYFGGLSNSAPVRTYYPRDVQRCRYTVVKFAHSVARESYAIYGITLSGTVGISTRAYR